MRESLRIYPTLTPRTQQGEDAKAILDPLMYLPLDEPSHFRVAC